MDHVNGMASQLRYLFLVSTDITAVTAEKVFFCHALTLLFVFYGTQKNVKIDYKKIIFWIVDMH